MKREFKIDPAHSSAQFTVRHMMITNVRGGFSGVSGVIVYDPDDLAASTIDVTIDASTINTLDQQRDAHRRSADFLDMAHYPSITFKSRMVTNGRDGSLTVAGDLTIRDNTRRVSLEVERPSSELKDPWGNLRLGASAFTKIKRSDFGLEWNAVLEAGGILVGDELAIAIEVSLIRS